MLQMILWVVQQAAVIPAILQEGQAVAGHLMLALKAAAAITAEAKAAAVAEEILVAMVVMVVSLAVTVAVGSELIN